MLNLVRADMSPVQMEKSAFEFSSFTVLYTSYVSADIPRYEIVRVDKVRL